MKGQMDVQQILMVLRKWGIQTLGQLAALDKEQLGARLGPEAIRLWERANGRCNRVLKLIRPPELFEEQFGLFESTLRNPHQLSETLARLIALLTSDRVGTPVLEETHRPDAFRMEPFTWAVESAVPSGESSHALRTPHATAALRRFRPALP